MPALGVDIHELRNVHQFFFSFEFNIYFSFLILTFIAKKLKSIS